jgi:hypothetical protein
MARHAAAKVGSASTAASRQRSASLAFPASFAAAPRASQSCERLRALAAGPLRSARSEKAMRR